MSPLETHMALVEDVLKGRSPAVLTPLLEAAQSAEPRGLVYRNSSLLAATDALKSNYLATAAIMGDAFFTGMARDYIAANRPTTRSLVGYGYSLPGFIAAASREHGLPWLEDMASLDRAWLEAHLARDAAPMPPEAFGEIASDEDALFDTQFDLSPSTRLVQCKWAVFDLWARLRGGDAPPDTAYHIADKTEQILIARPHGEVMYRQISAGHFALLYALKSGASLGGAAETALCQMPDLDIAQSLTDIIKDALFIARQPEG